MSSFTTISVEKLARLVGTPHRRRQLWTSAPTRTSRPIRSDPGRRTPPADRHSGLGFVILTASLP